MNKFLFKAIRFTGLPILFRKLIQVNKITILILHDISIDTAELLFPYLNSNYNIIHLNDLSDALYNKTENELPHKSVIITLDDGYIGNYKILPLLKKHHIPITIFLCSSLINTNRHFWFDLPKLTKEKSKLKQISNKERLMVLSKKGVCQEKNYDEPQALQEQQIHMMKNYINMQSHGEFHPIFPQCSAEEVKNEVFNSKEILENNYNISINAIAYPNGDYCERDIEIVKDAGYKIGLTIDFGFNTIKSDPFRLKRIGVSDNAGIDEIIVKVSGVWAFFKTLNGLIKNQ